MSELAELLKKSLTERMSRPLQAVDELKAAVGELSTAVHEASGGRLRVVLDRLKPKPKYGPTFALVLKTRTSERFLRVIVFQESGFPARLWTSYATWDQLESKDHSTRTAALKSTFELADLGALKSFFRDLVAGPGSELVRLIAEEMLAAGDDEGPVVEG